MPDSTVVELVFVELNLPEPEVVQIPKLLGFVVAPEIVKTALFPQTVTPEPTLTVGFKAAGAIPILIVSDADEHNPLLVDSNKSKAKPLDGDASCNVKPPPPVAVENI